MSVSELYNKVEDWLTTHASQYVEPDRLKKLGSTVAATYISYKIVMRVYDAYFGPLRDIPGPFYAKFISIPRAFLDYPRGTRFRQMKLLHDKYGTIIKLNPNTIAISNKDWLKEVLVKDDLPKGPNYSALQDDGKQTLFNTRDKAFHKQRRRVVSPAFALKYLNSLEPLIDSCTELFVKRISKDVEETKDETGFGTIDIWSMLACLALDIIGNTAFGESFNMVDNNDHFVPIAITRGMRLAPTLMLYPFLGKLIKLFRLNQSPEFDEFMRDLILKRLKSNQRRDDILQILIDSQQAQDQEDRLTVDAIIAEVVLFLIAGSETTSNTTGFAIIELLKHPDKLAKLQEEIDSVPIEDGQTLHTNDQLKHLPYLNAVINETMRLNIIATVGLQRITDRDIVLGGNTFIPKNTIVVCSLNHAQRNPDYWPDPESFLPERWLDDAVTPPCLDAFYPFSIGSRNCIGRQFALTELRKNLATLCSRYEFKAIPEELEQAKDIRQFITLTVQSNSFKILMRERNTQPL